jgi:hypothetical protein
MSDCFNCNYCNKDFVYDDDDYVLYSDGGIDYCSGWYGFKCPYCLAKELGLTCEIISGEQAENLIQINKIISDLYCFRVFE